MKVLLTQEGLWPIVTGRVPRPIIASEHIEGSPPSTPSQGQDWKQRDNLAMLRIISNVDDDDVKRISACNTSAEMWSALRQYYLIDDFNQYAYFEAHIGQANSINEIAGHLDKVLRLLADLTIDPDEDEEAAKAQEVDRSDELIRWLIKHSIPSDLVTVMAFEDANHGFDRGGRTVTREWVRFYLLRLLHDRRLRVWDRKRQRGKKTGKGGKGTISEGGNCDS